MDTLLSNDDGVIIFFEAPSATDEILAFHYGNFDNAYGDGTVAAAAANGRVYANTDPEDLPEEFGSIGTPTTASGQTTYTWTPPTTSLQANVLLVAGGGGGGGVTGSGASGGGGAGGLVFDTDRTIPSGQQTIVVGNGGAGGGNALVNGVNGKNSTAFGLTANGGGGGGGSSDGTTWNAGSAGGSGGGGGGGDANPNGAGGASTQAGTNSGVDIDAGFTGGGSLSSAGDCGGGGGGAGEKGDDFLGASIGNGYNIQGGDGLLLSVFGETYGESGWFAGGGGAFARNDNIARAGGLGGGGAGGSSGTNHTGGGGGGRDGGVTAGNGGSGVVLVRYIVDTAVIVSNYVVNRGLAVLLDAADTASYSGTGTTWTDISGNGRNGTLRGSVSWVDQGSASYFDFSGANADYINQTAGTTQIYKDICIVFQREDDGWNYLLASSTGSDRSLRINGSTLANPGNTGDWAQTATTYYVNGVADTNAVSVSQDQWYILGGENKNATLTGSAWNYHLGTGYSGRSLNGKIAFLALYTEPLTAAEHIHNYNALKHRFGV